MRFLLQTLMVLVLAFLLEMFLPWWAIAIAAALTGLAFQGGIGRSFLAGFLGIFLLWAVAGLMMAMTSDSVLPQKFGELLPGKPGAEVVALVAGLIGGLVGGFAAMSGGAIRLAVAGKSSK